MFYALCMARSLTNTCWCNDIIYARCSPISLPAPWLTILQATIRLLYHSHRRAFLASALASLAESRFFPAFILLLQRLLQQISAGGAAHVTPTVSQFGLGLLASILVQHLGIMVRNASSTILHRQAWVAISKQVMQKRRPSPIRSSKTMPPRHAMGW